MYDDHMSDCRDFDWPNRKIKLEDVPQTVLGRPRVPEMLQTRIKEQPSKILNEIKFEPRFVL